MLHLVRCDECITSEEIYWAPLQASLGMRNKVKEKVQKVLKFIRYILKYSMPFRVV
jgi:hypothetical protein